MNHHCIITCAAALESLLHDELSQWNIVATTTRMGQLHAQLPLDKIYHTCIWSRLASRVLITLFELPLDPMDAALHDNQQLLDQLYTIANEFEWQLVFDVDQSFAIRVHADRRFELNTQFAALRIKDGIVDHFYARLNRRPNVDLQQPDIHLHVYIETDHIRIALDISGESLHKRGYRQAMTDAPIKENLAAAILQYSGLNRESFDVIFDPMCGSGTFIIEALMHLACYAPGLGHTLGSAGWRGHDIAAWHACQVEANRLFNVGLNQPLPRMIAFDADSNAIAATRQNLIAAGFSELLPHIELHTCDIAQWPQFDFTGKRVLTITNPPYGERLGDKVHIRALYQGLGLALQNMPQQFATVLAADIEQLDVLPLATSPALRVMNGKLPVWVRHGVITPTKNAQELVTIWKPPAPATHELGQDFANRLIKNMQQCQKIARREHISCFRVYDADLPDYNFAIDIYGAWIHVQEYAPPKSIDPTKASERLHIALRLIREVFDVQRESVFIKTRAKQSGQNQYQKMGTTGKRFIVREAQAHLYVNLSDYLDSGLFLDHRPLRLKIAAQSSGLRMLNLFCYTAVASLHAALAGAKTTSVDLSATYINWAKQNFLLNGIALDEHRHQFINHDVFAWLKDCWEKYDLIFLDPPTFSNSKKFAGTFDIQRDHSALIRMAMRQLSDQGTLYFSNNFRQFELDSALGKTYAITEISAQTIGFDFKRKPKIHRAWEIKHRLL